MPILLNEPLARHGWWRVGGPMDRFVIADTLDELVAARSHGGPFLLLGNGSNLLAPDDGVRGTVVRLGAAFRGSDIVSDDGDAVRVRVGAGLPNAVLLARLAKLGLGGAGSLAGVPGTVGGAVAMNAGTVLGEIADALEAVEGIDAADSDGCKGPQRQREPTGATRTIARAALPMAYREGGLPEGFVVTAATLRLSRAAFAEEQAHIAHHLARRKATQPLDLPSCGSTFRNPPGDAAGRLIEAAGLKGHTVGAAQISPKHANFIVNLGGARASDVMACIRAAWSGVRERFGVALVPEVHVVGEWPAKVWPLTRSGEPQG